MELFEAINNRRSVRAFKSDPVPEEALNRILNAAVRAPSAGNRQSREFIVVNDGVVKRYLGDAALGQRFIEEAPVTIVVCANESRSAGIYGERGKKLYCLLDAAAAVQNMLLAAHALGLGACWVGAFNDEMVAKILNLPLGIRPVAIIPLGYPGQTNQAPPKPNLKDFIHLNRY